MANSRGQRGPGVPAPIASASPPVLHGMQGLSSSPPHLIASFGAEPIKDHTGGYDLGELEQPLSFNLDEELDLGERHSTVTSRPTLHILQSGPFRFSDTANKQRQQPNQQQQQQQSSQVTSPSAASTDSRSAHFTPRRHPSFESPSSRQFEHWGDSRMADNSPRTDTSTDMEADVKLEDAHHGANAGSNASDHEATKNGDSKALRRLAQNREAARKSRLRKKAYVQQLESSRIKLNQLEQELQRARQQGVYHLGGYGDQNPHGVGGNGVNGAINPGAAAFDMEYGRWVDEQIRQMCDLRAALQAHVADNELRVLVDGGMAHYDEIFRLKSIAAKADVFHLVSGMWKTPAERCFMWMGGFRPSELLKILIPQIEPLTEQQLLGICNLQQSSQQAEDALSQGMEALQQSLADTLAAGSLGSSPNVANYMGQMAMAMGKLGTLESFVRQADNLRQQTLQQMYRILTTRQAARGLLAMGDYFARLRALSSLWSARPRD
ncbi:transcription factor TGA [Marchantia polymorpha subsp. ruderalis]|uniref:BZIP domain-containing protein n=2 Tax=Marchantia polymorpha TaxID=3197 RepID=A0A2R6XAK6_MARPO|nr:hypothetical protein MARPO_0026s0039 [Marchantia polymorpha]BBN02164.1 hypothetical protein Mp_2g13330 [Marchantia polymorpha subsp. ruderalis]|eukprot:PTQ43150.1 hypothetical protein MARPO_0026s0039 [Marchantia polymorpha]